MEQVIMTLNFFFMIASSINKTPNRLDGIKYKY